MVLKIRELNLVEIGGSTPHKTLNARLSEDIIKHGLASRFVRTAQGRFSVRDMQWEPEVVVPARSIAPLHEVIKVLNLEKLGRLLVQTAGRPLYEVDRTALVASSTLCLRMEAEERYDIAQIIPSFVIKRQSELLSFIRTRKLPEARLHRTKSINFGGHLQADDFPELFAHDQNIVDAFLMRELFEELEFSGEINASFLGALYLTDTPFERQHVGLVYLINIPHTTQVRSIEPGFHANLQFEPIEVLLQNLTDLDSWSRSIAIDAGRGNSIDD